MPHDRQSRRRQPVINRSTRTTLKLKKLENAIGTQFKNYSIKPNRQIDLVNFLNQAKSIVSNQIKEDLRTSGSQKVEISVLVKLYKRSGEGIIEVEPHFNSSVQRITSPRDVASAYNEMSQKVQESFATYNNQGSGWIFSKVMELLLKTDSIPSISGSSFIELPKCLASKKAIINVQNEDNECFKYAVLSALHYDDIKYNPERVTKYKLYLDELNFKGIKFPVSLKDIDKFEKQNPQSINVYGYEKEVYVLRTSKKDPQNAIDLLLMTEGRKKHYCWIKNLSALLNKQVSVNNKKKYFCKLCMISFTSEEKLNDHITLCQNNDSCKIELPKEGETIVFKNYNRSMRVPFVIYADFEAITEKIDTCEPNPEESYTQNYQKHTPSGFCYYVKCSYDDDYAKPVVYRGEDCVEKFVEMIEEEVIDIYDIYKNKIPLKMTKNDWVKFRNSTHCHICKKELSNDKVIVLKKDPIHKSCTPEELKHLRESDLKESMEKEDWREYFKKTKCAICNKTLEGITVKDHDHLTGKFRGAAHRQCNLKYQLPKFVPVVFHNLSGYDAHLFIKQLGKTEGNINCIPNNEEKYISFSKSMYIDGDKWENKMEIRYIDSFKFMASSIDSLSKNLEEGQFREMKSIFGEDIEILTKKGVYPYDYMDSFKKFDDTQLPPKEEFYSKLNNNNISDSEYEHAKNVWNYFNIQNMGEYHDLYLESDVILLADIFENFRDVCNNQYNLDPAWYYTSPGLSWDAMLKKTNIELELLTDIDMILFIEKGIRGGVSMISNRYAKANNKYMDNYDSEKESSYIMYLDANNLYGWGMSQKLPYKDFKWTNDINTDNINDINTNGDKGYILEVDLEYPEHLHDLHNDYPLAPENIKIDKVNKLVPNLKNKERYILHIRNLQLYLSLGLKLTKVHKVLQFTQKEWMKTYIDLNTNLRAKSKNDFEKDFFKLMNNSVFGKTMENIRNRVDVRLINTKEHAEKFIVKPNYEGRTIFDSNLVAIHMKKTKIKFDKPIYVGICILDLSKVLMYDFHYNYIIKKYGSNQKLLFTDTDSLAYEIKTDDFYKDIGNDVESKFDTSGYPSNHVSGIKTGCNKKVIGMMKDECGGEQITEFVGLRAKMYSYRVNGDEEKKAKGVKKNVIKKELAFDDYYQCLIETKPLYKKMNLIRSDKHNLYTQTVNKIALSADDDKRVISKDGISTLAYGHYKLTNE